MLEEDKSCVEDAKPCDKTVAITLPLALTEAMRLLQGISRD